MARPYKYAPLAGFLRERPPTAERVTLTLGELEAIVGAPLPSTAYQQRWSWWSNSQQATHAWPWRSVGWRVAPPVARPGGPRQWTVTFTRAPSDTIAAPRAGEHPPAPTSVRERRFTPIMDS